MRKEMHVFYGAFNRISKRTRNISFSFPFMLAGKKSTLEKKSLSGISAFVGMRIKRYFSVPTQTKAKYHFFGVVIGTIALTVGLIVGGWNIYKAVLALSESTKTMPADVAFNRGVSGSLASYLDSEGKIEVASSSVKLAKLTTWWDESFKYRKQITLKNLSSSSISTSSAQITVDTKSLVEAGKLLGTCNDLRIAKQATGGASMVEQPRSYTIAAGATSCSDSTATIVTFGINETLDANASSSPYFLYYGNSSASSTSFGSALSGNFNINPFELLYASAPTAMKNLDTATWEFWVKPSTSAGEYFLLNKYLSGGYVEWAIKQSGTALKIVVSPDGKDASTQSFTTPSGVITANSWQHIAVTHLSGTGFVVYVNGRLISSFSYTQPLYNSLDGRSFRFGKDSGSNGIFTGAVDDIRIWNIVRSPAEINSNIYQTLNGNESGLISYWKLDEGSGSTAANSVSGGGSAGVTTGGWISSGVGLMANSLGAKSATLVCPFNGTTTCLGGVTPTTSTGAIRYATGSAMVFDGINDYINVPSSTTIDKSYSNGITGEAWFNFNYNRSLGIGSDFAGLWRIDGNSVAGNRFNMTIYYGKPQCNIRNVSVLGSVVTTYTWHHVACTYDNSQIKLYVDGVLDGTAVATGTFSPTGAFTIGMENGYFRSGSIDEVRISDKVRYDASFTPQTKQFEPDSNTVTLYHFDENGDDPRNTGKAMDASGNGNNGTIVGAQYATGSPVKNGSFASHEGVFIEEGTTNLITNPSFENSSATLNWGPSAFTYATASATFTPNMAKRNSAGPFAAGPIVQGKMDGSGTSDLLSNTRGNNIAGNYYQNLDGDQGSIVFWITPEWNGNDGIRHLFYGSDSFGVFKHTDNKLYFRGNWDLTYGIDISNWTAGTTYNVVARWDVRNKIDGTNYISLSVNDGHSFGAMGLGSVAPAGTSGIGSNGSTNPANAIIEGLTIYRRVLFDGTYGTDMGNGDEINQIYNGGTGKDPTLVTGSWDVVFALPTNGSIGALATGTGNAWSMPHTSNLLGGTNGKNGFMMGANAAADSLTAFSPNKLANGTFEYDLSNWTATPSYTLNDTFNTDLAAGAVNGTLATDGVSARLVTDANSKLSISGGTMNFATGGVTWGDPGIWYPSVSRVAGRMLVGKINRALGSSIIGFGAATSGFPSDSVVYTDGSGNIWHDGGSAVVGSEATGTDYITATILRGSGSYTFIKGGAYTNWTLLWVKSTSSTATLYPGVSVGTNATVYSADNIRIPSALWLPTPLAYDTFATDSATLTEGVGPDNQSTQQLTWTGGAKTGGKMVITPTLGSELHTQADAASDPNSNEANSITGWGTGSDNSLSSDPSSPQAGTYSIRSVKASNLGNSNASRGFASTVGQWYQTSSWIKNDTGVSSVIMSIDTAQTLLTTSNTTWANYFVAGRATATTSNFQIRHSGTYPVPFNVDNLSIKPLTTSSLFSSISTTDSDVIANTDVTMAAGTQAGLVLNLDSASNPQNFVIAYIDGTRIHMDKAVGGIYTEVLNTTYTHVAGATLRVTKDGTNYTVFYNNANLGVRTISDAGIISNTRHGLFSTYSGNTFDNFTVFPRGSSATKFSDIPAEELTATRDTVTKYSSNASVKLVAGGNDANFWQTINVGNTDTYNFSSYAYTTGAAVTAADVELYYGSATISGTYTSVGSGWYRIDGTATGIASNQIAGVRVKAGKTVYVDGFSFVSQNLTTTSAQLSTANKIFSGGYGVAAQQWGGLYKDITVTAGQDIVIRGIANSDGTSQPRIVAYDQNNGADIGSLNGTTTSTKAAPDNLLFTAEAPAGCTTIRLMLVNGSTSGTVNWHQVEVYANKVNGPSIEAGAGDPWIPTGWYNGNSMTAGQSTQELSTVHSGYSAISLETTMAAPKYLGQTITSTTQGKFYSTGMFLKSKNGSNPIYIGYVGDTMQNNGIGGAQYYSEISGSNWVNFKYVVRKTSASTTMAFGQQVLATRAGRVIIDDAYIIPLDDVTLTATPAIQANSTETTGIRVDGADTLTQPITGLSTTNGVIKFKFTPRHSWSIEENFGNTAGGIVSLWGDANNYIGLYKVSGSLRLYGIFNGTALNANWANPTLNTGTTYSFEISYQAGSKLVLKVDGSEVTSVTGVVPFVLTPTVWAAQAPLYEGTYASFVAAAVTENTSAPYYKFGSKSAKIVAYDMPDQYLTVATASANAAYTLSAYVYDGTTGNNGGIMASTSAQLASASAALATTYTDMGGGWWRLSNTSATMPAGTYNLGVQVQAGKTVYVDGVQLEQLGYSTTYADGSLGTGYAWSGTANNSKSTRTMTDFRYSATGVFGLGSGSFSTWFKTDDWSKGGRYFFKNDAAPGSNWWISSNSSGLGLYINDINNVSRGSVNKGFSFLANTWYHVVATWDNTNQQLKLCVDGSCSTGTTTGIYAPFSSTFGFSIGNNVYMAPRTFYSDFRAYDQALSTTDVANLYNSGLISHSNGTESADRYNALGTYTSPVMDLAANGQWSDSTPIAFSQALNGGTVAYATRTSADNTIWSLWETVAGSTIASLPRRYLQWKADLTPSSGATPESPVISDMTVKYIEDTTAPVNPSEVALGYGSSATGSANLISGTWYNYAHPQFVWDAAEDSVTNGQSTSGIGSYYAFFTQDTSATPSANVADDCFRATTDLDRSITIGTTPALCTLTDGTYYLRIQAKDNSGNISDPVTLFTYKYDGSIPNAPASVSSTSVGYTSNNSFIFFWPESIDNGPSGVKGYEYKTGTSAGAFADWTFTTGTLARDISAYKEGQNFFLVRTVDNGGNVSGNTSNNVTMASFYFNASAPTRPQNVNISPETSEASASASNVFTVTWDKPATFSGEIQKYYYCVNCTPAQNVMTETTAAETVNRSLATIALATQQGKNTLFMVAEDNNLSPDTGHGNHNFNAYSSTDFYASTVAPAAPTSLVVSDASDRDNTIWRLTLTWKAPSTGGVPKMYQVYRAEGIGEYVKLGETTSTAYTDADLAQGASYSYKVRAVDNAGSYSLFSAIVLRSPEGKYTSPPTAGGIPTSTSGSTTATIKWTTSRLSFGTVEYGKTINYGSAATETIATKDHIVKVTGLAPGVSYHYRVQSLDDSSMVDYNRVDAYSSDYSFSTLNTAAITGIEVTDIGLDSAVITWKTSSLATSRVEYGLTLDYGSSINVSSEASESAHTTRVAGLTHSTVYHFRVRGTTTDGDDIYSQDNSFQTTIFPKVTALVMNTDQDAAGTTVVLAWSTNVPTTAEIVYQGAVIDTAESLKLKAKSITNEELQKMTQGELAAMPVIPKGQQQILYSGELLDKHIQRISGLTDASIYIFTIRGRDSKGNQAISDPIRYVTGADTRPPTLQNVIIETPMNGVGADATAQIIVSWETDEPSTSQVLWGAGTGSEYPQASEKETALTTKHVIVLRDLLPTSSYHMKIMSADKTGNIAESKDTVVVTPSSQQAAFDIIIKNLEDVFGFLKL